MPILGDQSEVNEDDDTKSELDFCQKEKSNQDETLEEKKGLNEHVSTLLYKCDICESRFARKQGLNQHKRLVHENNYKCDLCESRFGKEERLELHKKVIHKDYVIPHRHIFDKSLANKTYLKAHKAIVHEKKMPTLGNQSEVNEDDKTKSELDLPEGLLTNSEYFKSTQ